MITIRDQATGSTASLLPECGFNCFSFRPVIDGQPIEVFWAEPGFGPESPPDLSGIPILFPWGGRMTGGTFSFDGKTYCAKSAMGDRPDAWHGFVMRRPWRVVDEDDDHATAEFQASIDDPSLLDEWPADFKISVTYRVAGPELRAEFTVSNPSERRLPFVLATHPYFQLSLGGAKPEAARVTIPASAHWELNDGAMSGRKLPVNERNDLRDGPALDDRKMNDIYADLQMSGGAFTCSVRDPIANRTVSQISSDKTECCIVYTHREREAIAIEPYLGLPDVFHLAEIGAASGPRVLEPGETHRTTITIRLD
jgi:aldose 1-epimerase